MRDFNEVTSLDEKLGGLLKCPRLIGALRNLIDDCSLVDLGSKGFRFTWSNKRGEGANLIYACLDWFLGTSRLDLFPGYEV